MSVILFLMVLNSPVLADPSVQVDGKQVSFDVPPIIENGRTLVPLRAIFEAFGADVAWDAETQTISATYDSKHLRLIIGSPVGYMDGLIIPLDTEPKIVDGRTLVPLRFVSEALGFNIDWDASTQAVAIKTSHKAVYDDSDWINITDTMGKIVCSEEIVDNNYVLLGDHLTASEDSQGENTDLDLMFLDYSGYLLDDKHFGDPLYNEEPLTFAATQDNCYNLSFTANIYHECILCLAKIGYEGTIWDFTIPCDPDSTTNIVQTSDAANAFVIKQINGLIESNHLIKVDIDGKKCLDKVLGNETINCICPSSDGGLVMVGTKDSFLGDNSDDSYSQAIVYVIKTDNKGNIKWSQTYEDKFAYEPNCIIKSSDGYVIAGKVISSEDKSRAFVMKIDTQGNLLWEKSYGGPDYSEAFWICNTKDNGFVFTGSTEYYDDNYDFWLVKIDELGNLVFDKRFGSENEDAGLYVAETSDGGIIASGYIDGTLDENPKGFVVKTDANGEIH